MQHRVQDTVHHSQENKREAPNSPPGKNLYVNKVNFPDFFVFFFFFGFLSPQLPRNCCRLGSGAEIAPGHNITGHKCCFDTSYMREKNRRDELTQAQELIQEQEGKKGKRSPSPSQSKVANQGSG